MYKETLLTLVDALTMKRASLLFTALQRQEDYLIKE